MCAERSFPLFVAAAVAVAGCGQERGSPPGAMWPLRFGSFSDDEGVAVGVDADANILVTGFFSGRVSFGGQAFDAGPCDAAFVGKFSPAASHLWSRQLGGVTGCAEAMSLSIDPGGDVVTAGVLALSGDFGGGTVTSAGLGDAFVGKYASVDGTHVWSARFGGSGADAAYGVATDAVGDVVLVGPFQDAVDFGSGLLTSAGGTDVFVLKLSGAGGATIWARRFGGAWDDFGNGIAVGPSGDVVVAGTFQGSADFGGGSVTAAGTPAAFLAEYRGADGAHVWSHTFGSSLANETIVQAIAIANDGTAFVTGMFTGNVDLGGGLLAGGAGAGFVAAFSGLGAHQWSRRLPLAPGRGIAVTPGGMVAVSGEYSFSTDLGGGTLVSAGRNDVFIAQYDAAAGAFAGAEHFGGSDDDWGNGVATASDGTIALTGVFTGTATFGNASLTSAGQRDAFLARFLP